MAGQKISGHILSRRKFLKGMRWAPVVFLPAKIGALPFSTVSSRGCIDQKSFPVFSDVRLTPHYPAKPPLDDLLAHVIPGRDGYLNEKYGAERMRLLAEWSSALKLALPGTSVLAKVIAESINAGSAVPLQEAVVRSANGIEVLRRRFNSTTLPGRGRFLQQLQSYFSDFAQLETADFLIMKIIESAASSAAVEVDIRYEFVGTREGIGLEQQIGLW